MNEVMLLAHRAALMILKCLPVLAEWVNHVP